MTTRPVEISVRGIIDVSTRVRTCVALGNAGRAPIELYVDSPGGELAAAAPIYRRLLAHPAPVTALIDRAYSAAGIIAMAAGERVVHDGSRMMVHDAHVGANPDGLAAAIVAEVLEEDNRQIAEILAERAGGPARYWRHMMRQESWYTGAEAVKAGLATVRTSDFEWWKWSRGVLGWAA